MWETCETMTETQPNSPIETSAIPDPFQSQKKLRAILKLAQVTPSARKGQAFLIERHLMEKLVASAELGKQDLVIEVGTGTGPLLRPRRQFPYPRDRSC